jgi:hypothetical protein
MNWLGDHLSGRWDESDRAERETAAKVDAVFAEAADRGYLRRMSAAALEVRDQVRDQAEAREGLYGPGIADEDPVCPDCGGEGVRASLGWPETCSGCGGYGTL